jgi:Na+:H+ antiporter, NhaA family
MEVPESFPPRPITTLTRPFIRFMHLQASGGLMLVFATITALVAANTVLADDYAELWNQPFTIGIGAARLSYPLWYWINDGLMAIFFFVIGLEIKRELIWGELRDKRNVILPAIAALGGAVIPVGIFLALQHRGDAASGWAIPMATDIAFVVGCLAVLGPRVPPGLKVFMLSLAIIDDILAVVVIAVVFSTSIDLVWLAGALGALSLAYVFNRVGIRRIGIYVFVGAIMWLCTLKSGIHPTIAGVLLGLLTPATAWIDPSKLASIVEQTLPRFRDESESAAERKAAAETLAIAATESVSPLERLEHALHSWVAFAIMPLFALANAGVPVSIDGMREPVSVAVVAGLALGKPIGIAGAAFLAIKLGLARLPERTSWLALVGSAWLGGIGFTMALFIASLSLSDSVLGAAKSGILLGSVLSLVAGMTILVLALRRQRPPSAVEGSASLPPVP